MEYSQYGRSGAKVSRVGFGGMRFDLSRSMEENAELLLYAREKGVNYFDTAPGYCEDKSEDIFGHAIKQMQADRDNFYVSTKGMPTEIQTADKAVEAVEKSIKRLNVEKIDFYHVWCVRKMEQYEMAMKPGGQYEGLLRCKEKGLIDHIVISSHLVGPDIRQILEKGEFEGVLLGVNVLNFMYRWEAVQAAQDLGLGVVAMNPLYGGIIPKHADDLGFLASEGETPVEAALRFCISSPQISVTLVGFTDKEHIDTACEVEQNSRAFNEEDMERIRENVSRNIIEMCTGCGYCLGICPREIHVPGYMQVLNDHIMTNKSDKEMVEKLKFEHEWALLADSKGKAADCIGCKRCEEVCTQHLDIVDRLETLATWEQQMEAST